jgi:cystathionine gamma-lyase
MTRKPSLASLSINAGAPAPKDGSPFRHGPEFASTFHLSGDVDPEAYQYGRFGQPTWTSLETGLREMEGGDTVIFPSGMSAASAILTSLIKPGDTILLPSDGYAPVRYYAEQYLVKFGVKLKTIATQDIDDLKRPATQCLIRLISPRLHRNYISMVACSPSTTPPSPF